MLPTLLEPVLGSLTEHLIALAPTPQPQLPTPAPSPPPGLEPVVIMFFSWGKYLLSVAGAAGFFICAGMMMWGRRNRSSTAVDGATGIPWVLAGLSLMSLAVGIVSATL